MQSPPTIQRPAERRPHPLRVFCEVCTHTEFVHSDLAARRCLYAECGCREFRASVTAA